MSSSLFVLHYGSFYVHSHVFRSVEKATTMSKRIQEGKEEEPAVAKPRFVCLITSSLNKAQSSSFGPDVSNIPGNPQLDSGSVNGAAGNCERDIVKRAAGNRKRNSVQNKIQKPETCSQVLKRDNRFERDCGKLQRYTAQGAVPESAKGPR